MAILIEVCDSDMVRCITDALCLILFFFKQKTAYEMRISDWSSDVCSSDLEVGKIRGWMTALLQGVADGWVRPHVDQVFSFAQAGEAQTYIEARRNIGKVVLRPD